ncbi:MAG: tRNA (adenosine(37)-N6)-threonylcarbamoyltransferase complex transferase subunit TsaD [Parcubacteria group bacterium]
MLILGIETSCDETSIAVLEYSRGSVFIRSCIISSQVKLHAKYGGVVPSLAAREHTENLPRILNLALKKAKVTMKDIDLIAVTSGPGLIMALLVGVAFAKALAWKYDKPLIATNHMEGHMYSNWLASDPKLSNKKIFPILHLVVSGGHTQLILMKSHCSYKLLGQTVDDAAGEAFDKTARILGLPYPGGPNLSREADKFNPDKSKLNIDLPRPMINSKNYDFSFSGLKTAVLYLVRDLKKKYKLSAIKSELAYEIQKTIVDVLITKTKRAANNHRIGAIMLSGGVSANKLLRSELTKLGKNLNIPVIMPEMRYTTDNAAMIAMAGLVNIKYGKKRRKKVEADANWEIV